MILLLETLAQLGSSAERRRKEADFAFDDPFWDY